MVFGRLWTQIGPKFGFLLRNERDPDQVRRQSVRMSPNSSFEVSCVGLSPLNCLAPAFSACQDVIAESGDVQIQSIVQHIVMVNIRRLSRKCEQHAAKTNILVLCSCLVK